MRILIMIFVLTKLNNDFCSFLIMISRSRFLIMICDDFNNDLLILIFNNDYFVINNDSLIMIF